MKGLPSHPRGLGGGDIHLIAARVRLTNGGIEMPTTVEQFTRAERAAAGKAARQGLPRERYAGWDSARRSVDPLDLSAEQALSREAELVPIRFGRELLWPWPPSWPVSAIPDCW
jgi:hypothetical protein